MPKQKTCIYVRIPINLCNFAAAFCAWPRLYGGDCFLHRWLRQGAMTMECLTNLL